MTVAQQYTGNPRGIYASGATLVVTTLLVVGYFLISYPPMAKSDVQPTVAVSAPNAPNFPDCPGSNPTRHRRAKEILEKYNQFRSSKPDAGAVRDFWSRYSRGVDGDIMDMTDHKCRTPDGSYIATRLSEVRWWFEQFIRLHP